MNVRSSWPRGASSSSMGTNERPTRPREPGDHVRRGGQGLRAGSIEVLVIANGSDVSRGILVVNSTAINPIALMITIGAGWCWWVLWARRLFRRRNP